MMMERIQYDKDFKKTVVGLLENGQLSSIEEARRRFNIKGSMTVSKWIRSIKPDLLPKLKIRKLREELQLLRDTDPELYNAIQRVL